MKKMLSIALSLIFILSLASPVLAAGPKSIVSIQVTKEPTMTEGTNGYFINAQDPVTHEQLGGYFEYYADPLEVKITFAGGDTTTVTSDYECYQATGSYWSVVSDQSVMNPWGAGDHTATVTIGSNIASYNVTVMPSNVEELILEDITLIEGLDGHYEDEYNENTGAVDSYFRYTLYSWSSKVRLSDGSSDGIYSGYYDTLSDEWGELCFADGQSVYSPWGVGVHKVTGYLLGRTCEFNVTVIENPIESLEFHDITLYDGLNTYTAYGGKKIYYYDYDFTVHFKDGTSQRSYNGYVDYNGTYIYASGDDEQYTHPWSPGEMHYVPVTVAGQWGYQRIEIKTNPYCDMTIFEDANMDLHVRLWKNAYLYDEYKVDDLIVSGNIYRGEDENGWLDAVIRFNHIPFMTKMHYAHDPSGIPYYEQDFRIRIGELESDNHFDILWLKKEILLSRYAGYTYTQPYFDPSFKSMRRDLYDLDTVVQLACNIRGLFDGYGEYGWDGEYSYIFVETREAVEAVQYVFGIDIEDEIRNYKYYPSDPDWQFQVRVNASSMTDYLQTTGFKPKKDGAGYRWMNAHFIRVDHGRDMIRFKLDADLTINSINFYKTGDITGEGKVTMADVLILRKYLANIETLSEEQIARADFNGDGKVTAKDVLALRKYLAGIYE